MFAFLSSGDWRELVDESGLALVDRVAVALRVLSDSALLPFLHSLSQELLHSGDLESILLFGLRPPMDLLSAYLDRSADIQTVALACSFIHPAIVVKSPRVERWLDTYRGLLNHWGLYTERALLDGAMGRRGREAVLEERAAGRGDKAREIERCLEAKAPRQLMVRCTFCSIAIAPPAVGSSGERVVAVKVCCPTLGSTANGETGDFMPLMLEIPPFLLHLSRSNGGTSLHYRLLHFARRRSAKWSRVRVDRILPKMSTLGSYGASLRLVRAESRVPCGRLRLSLCFLVHQLIAMTKF